MTMSDVVSRLLAAIDERARKAEACIAEVGSDRVGDEYADGSGTADRDDFPSYPWGSADAELAFMAGPGHPDSVLRLCQSHRDIVSAYEQQRQMAAQLEEVDFEAYLTASGVVAGLKAAIALVARGYGVEDGETK